MSKFIGRLVNVGIGKESTRGGGGGTPTYEIPLTSFSFDDKIVKARSVGSLSNIADSEGAFVTTKYGQGDMEGEIRSKSFGLLLYAMLGTLSTSGPTDTTVYTHAFTVAQTNQHQSLYFVVDDPNTNEMYRLVMLDSLEIKSELDQIAMFTASFMSKAGMDTSLGAGSVVAEDRFTKRHLSVKLAADISSLAAANAISVKSVSLKISKNLALDDVIGTAEPEDILNRQLSVEGEMTLNYEAETYKNYMRDGSYKAMQLDFLNPDNKITGAASTYPELKIQLPRVDFYDWEPTYDLDEIVTQKISFKASRDVANSQEIIHLCQLINGVTSY